MTKGVVRVSGPGEGRRLGLGGVAQVLGVPRLTAWWWVRTGQLRPYHSDGDEQWWTPDDVYRWASRQPGKKLAGRAPLPYWPTFGAGSLAEYLGAVDLRGAVATRWQTAWAPIAVVWPLPSDLPPPGPGDWARQIDPRGRGAVVQVVAMGDRRPTLLGVLPDDGGTYELDWEDLWRATGARLPYWPTTLRHRDLLHDWQPGDTAVTALAESDVDTAALLQLASTYEAGSPPVQVLFHLAQRANRDAYDRAERELHQLAAANGPKLDDFDVAVAARPVPVPDVPDHDDVDDDQRRKVWMDVLDRTDLLATRSVLSAAQMIGVDLPASHRVLVYPGRSEWAGEWADRLEPARRTAAHDALRAEGTFLQDPLTTAAVTRRADGVLVAALPRKLPASTPLAELILDQLIWVRTEDGTLYPAPHPETYGLTWGYSGAGPGTLARVIDALLDDITATAPDETDGAPDGLVKLARTKLPRGTVLTRRDLESARAGRWMPVFVDRPEDPKEDQ